MSPTVLNIEDVRIRNKIHNGLYTHETYILGNLDKVQIIKQSTYNL